MSIYCFSFLYGVFVVKCIMHENRNTNTIGMEEIKSDETKWDKVGGNVDSSCAGCGKYSKSGGSGGKKEKGGFEWNVSCSAWHFNCYTDMD
jgi:hypothetical protein